jgi:hypothetical protein
MCLKIMATLISQFKMAVGCQVQTAVQMNTSLLETIIRCSLIRLALLVLRAHKEHKEDKERKALRDFRGYKALKVYKERRDYKERRVFRYKVPRVFKVHKV